MSKAAAVTADAASHSPPPVPALGSAIGAVFRLQWKRLIRGKKLRLGAVATVLIVIAVTAARYAVDTTGPADVVKGGTQLGWFRLLVYLLPFLFCSGAIAEDVDGRVFTYLSSRPVSRLAITLGKYLAGVSMAILLLVGGMLLLHLACYVSEPTPLVEEFPNLARRAGAVSLNALAVGAICLFWGALVVEAAGIVATLHLALLEWLFSLLPAFLPFVSMNYHAIMLAGFEGSGPMAPLQTVPDTWVPAVVIPVVTLVFLGFSVLVVSSSEYRSKDA